MFIINQCSVSTSKNNSTAFTHAKHNNKTLKCSLCYLVVSIVSNIGSLPANCISFMRLMQSGLPLSLSLSLLLLLLSPSLLLYMRLRGAEPANLPCNMMIAKNARHRSCHATVAMSQVLRTLENHFEPQIIQSQQQLNSLSWGNCVVRVYLRFIQLVFGVVYLSSVQVCSSVNQG